MDLAGWCAMLPSHETLFERVALASVELLVLFVFVLLLVAVVRMRSPRAALLLWLIVLMKPLFSLSLGSLLIVPVFRLPESVSQVSHVSGGSESAHVFIDEGPGLDTEAEEVMAYEMPNARSEDVATGMVEQRPAPSINWREMLPRVLIVGWLLGAGVLALRYLVARWRLGWILRHAKPAPSSLEQRCAELTIRFNAARPPRLRVTDELDSPAIAGLMRPTILMPAWLVAEADDAQIEWTLRHELTHWRWCDLWVVALRDGVCTLFWFHPAAWWAGRRLIEAMEQACDQAMLTDTNEAATYAEQLYLLQKKMKDHRRAVIAGGLFATRTQVGKRIAALLDGSFVQGPSLTARSIAGVAVLAAAALSVGVGFAVSAQGTRAAESTDATRVLCFPSNRTVGWLTVTSPQEGDGFFPLYYDEDGFDSTRTVTVVGDVRGDVEVPADGLCTLRIRPQGMHDLAWVRKLKPDDLYGFGLPYHPPDQSGPRPNDRILPSITHLTGLKFLTLEYGGFTSRGLRHLEKLESLERLTLPVGLTGEGLAQIVRIKSLKAMAFIDPQITDDDLALLANLPELEELHLGGTLLTDAGLAHLANVPKLRYLRLWGPNFTDEGMVHLQQIPSLRILSLSRQPIGDAGVAHLAKLTRLEGLSLYHTRVTDDGLAHLPAMRSLKWLDLGSWGGRDIPPLTDAGMVHVGRIQSLESLRLASDGITDKGMAHLAGLSRMKSLRAGGSSNSPLGDGALEAIGHMRLLEELNIGGIHITDDGLKSLVPLTKLRALSLFSTTAVTDAGLASLAELTSLQSLHLKYLSLSIAGLKQLNTLSGLKDLDVVGVRQDDSVLDLSGLSKLEKLNLGSGIHKGRGYTDHDLAALEHLPQLRELAVSGEFTDEGMVHVGKLTELVKLAIGSPRLTDKALAEVARCPHIWHLFIRGHFTDRGLNHLGLHPALGVLMIDPGERPFSTQAVARLNSRKPDLNFVYDGAIARGQARGFGGGKGR